MGVHDQPFLHTPSRYLNDCLYLPHLANIIQPSKLVVPWPWNMLIIFCEPLEQIIIINFYTYIHAKFGWSYIHGTVCRNYCSSQEYSHEPVFITWFSHVVTLNIKNINNLRYRHCSQYSYFINWHYSLFQPASFPSLYLSFFPWK
jgi:hypothetical protein